MPTFNLVDQGSFPIGIGRMKPQVTDRELHRHDNVELAIITGGSGRHRTRDGAYAIARGDVFIIPIGTVHGYDQVRDLHLVNLGYDPRRLALPMTRLLAMPGYRVLVDLEPGARRSQGFAGHLHLSDAGLAWLLAGIDELERELGEAAQGWQESATATLVRILVRLARAFTTHDNPQAQTSLRLGAVLAHIDGHLGGELSLVRLGALASVSPSTLQRAFRRLLGQSVAQYVIGRRLALACELLTAGISVAESARRVGIDDPCYFARLFRRRMGCTARRYRNQQQHLHARL